MQKNISNKSPNAPNIKNRKLKFLKPENLNFEQSFHNVLTSVGESKNLLQFLIEYNNLEKKIIFLEVNLTKISFVIIFIKQLEWTYPDIKVKKF
jgi:hypothetical protein